MAHEMVSEIVAMGWRSPDGIHNQPPYSPWQLTDNPDYPFGIKSASGVNCLGGLKASGGSPFAHREVVEAICAALSQKEVHGG